MSKILSLSESYGSFFWNCTKFAIYPYTNTFMAMVKNAEKDGNDSCSSLIAASIVTGVLTFVVPILPVFASFTFALASIAMLLAVVSMFVTYPIAILADACTDGFDSGHSLAY